MTRFVFFYHFRLDALTQQHTLLYIIATFRTGGGSPTSIKQVEVRQYKHCGSKTSYIL